MVKQIAVHLDHKTRTLLYSDFYSNICIHSKAVYNNGIHDLLYNTLYQAVNSHRDILRVSMNSFCND